MTKRVGGAVANPPGAIILGVLLPGSCQIRGLGAPHLRVAGKIVYEVELRRPHSAGSLGSRLHSSPDLSFIQKVSERGKGVPEVHG